MAEIHIIFERFAAGSFQIGTQQATVHSQTQTTQQSWLKGAIKVILRTFIEENSYKSGKNNLKRLEGELHCNNTGNTQRRPASKSRTDLRKSNNFLKVSWIYIFFGVWFDHEKWNEFCFLLTFFLPQKTNQISVAGLIMGSPFMVALFWHLSELYERWVGCLLPAIPFLVKIWLFWGSHHSATLLFFYNFQGGDYHKMPPQWLQLESLLRIERKKEVVLSSQIYQRHIAHMPKIGLS